MERAIIGLINERSGYLKAELTGLSVEAVKTWFDGVSETARLNSDIKGVKDKLEYIGRLTKLESNGSHRGAMVAPAPNEEVVGQLVNEIVRMLVKLPFSKVN